MALIVYDVTESAKERISLKERLEETRQEFERARREAEAEVSRYETHNERLIETNRQLEAANRELTEFNQELRVAGEDSVISTEEAQAATEEVETLNEELQATNEELETLNEELQATVEELNTTNDDLQARSAELQEIAREREMGRRESERARHLLEATMRGISDAVLAVNDEAEVLITNDAFIEVFGDVSAGDSANELLSQLTLLDESGEELPGKMLPSARVARGESFEMRFSFEGKAGGRRVFEVRGRPIEGGETYGGVLALREAQE